MFKLTTCFLLILISFSSWAADTRNETLIFLAEKAIEDFQTGIESYNVNKAKNTPTIERDEVGLYSFKVQKDKVEFTLVTYLNDQILINGQLVSKSKFGLNKTTLLDFLVATVIADDMPTLSGESARIILATLGSLAGELDKAGMVCLSGCKKELREKNLPKVLRVLDQKKEECEAGERAQADSLINTEADAMGRRSPYKDIRLLHSSTKPEFQGVKSFFEKIAKAHKKGADAFMAEKLGISESSKSCIEVMVTGTVASDGLDGLDKGITAIKLKGAMGSAIEAAFSKAKDACIKMEELKRCLLSVRENLSKINYIKRSDSKNAGKGEEPELPPLKSLER